ncbi:hypothetical protein EU811_06785 [Arthrobacter sp. TS-15]|uniref:hypothetical protein n=1 Tax=Arthrobacter sp. TS-15 TaxID=2510797 RepID=UPI00115D7D41|nr:hypothetical protein [Arthrobacter sp. TS-15]TQS93200.1 hypothetical protein EU811_06785 [Arthrobacter sp. TS-15]
METPAASTDMRSKKLKAIKNGDSVRISDEVFQVNSVEPEEGSRNIKLELEGLDGGSVTLIGRPKARMQLTARAS